MKRAIVASFLFAVAAASCTDTPSEPRTATEVSELTEVTQACGCVDGVTADPWTGQSDFWPQGAKGVVYVLTSNNQDMQHPGTFLAFGFINQGYSLAWVYRVQLSQYGAFVGAVNASLASHMVANGTTVVDVWSGGTGGLDGVGPAGGGGPIPHGYLQRVQRTAAQIIDATRMQQRADSQGNVTFGQ